jgi:hypothetical protein
MIEQDKEKREDLPTRSIKTCLTLRSSFNRHSVSLQKRNYLKCWWTNTQFPSKKIPWGAFFWGNRQLSEHFFPSITCFIFLSCLTIMSCVYRLSYLSSGKSVSSTGILCSHELPARESDLDLDRNKFTILYLLICIIFLKYMYTILLYIVKIRCTPQIFFVCMQIQRVWLL